MNAEPKAEVLDVLQIALSTLRRIATDSAPSWNYLNELSIACEKAERLLAEIEGEK